MQRQRPRTVVPASKPPRSAGSPPAAPRAPGTHYLSTTIQKAFDILSLFKTQTELSFQEIQGRLGFNKSTLFRLLYTLERNEYVRRSESGKYHVGLAVYILGNTFSRENHLLNAAAPYLRELSQKLSLTVHLGILEKAHVIVLNKIDPPHGIGMLSRIGIELPVHCTGQGKALLAFSAPETVQGIFNTHSLRRYTPNTITTVDGLRHELELIRERGYAVDNSEHEKHIKCVAVPILNRQQRAEAALSITGLIVDFPTVETIEAHASALQGVAANISRDLGFM